MSGSFFEVWEDDVRDAADTPVAEYRVRYILYDAAGSDLEDILNYTYHYAEFYPDENGKLTLIRIYDGLCCAEKLADYPVISADEAYELLRKGNYLTSAPYGITGRSLICKTELVYRNSRTEETFLPYYRFFVKLPDTQNRLSILSFS